MKRSILSALFLTLILVINGCSSAQKSDHSHSPDGVPEYSDTKVQFEGHCAHSVLKGDFKSKGNPEFKVDYKGKTYLFSDAKKRDHFLDHLKGNVKKAQKKWEGRSIYDRK